MVQNDKALMGGGSERRVGDVARKYELAAGFLIARPPARFTDGRRDFRTTPIPGWKHTLSALEMKSLFLKGRFVYSGGLTLEQQGALTVFIENKSMEELVSGALKISGKVAEDFRRMGSTFDRLFPQAFYLPLAGDKNGGRCYPLVMAMTVALAESGLPGVNHLVDKLFQAAAQPQEIYSKLLLESLRYLHVSDETRAASTVLHQDVTTGHTLKPKSYFTLVDVIFQLEKATTTSLFALNTSTHSMMVGQTLGTEGRRYYFYDPNFGIFGFPDTNSLAKAMHQHFAKHNYAAFGSKSNPEFNLFNIDTRKMARVTMDNGLTLADLSKPAELTPGLGRAQQIKVLLNTQAEIANNTSLGSTLATLNAESWGERFKQATIQLVKKAGLTHQWLPVISTLKDLGKDDYTIQFIHLKRLDEVRVVNTRDSLFAQFRRFVDTHLGTLGRHFILESGQLRPTGSNAAPIDGLNAGFTMQALINWFAASNRRDVTQGGTSADLALALKVHSYLNLTQMVHAGVQDVGKIIHLVRAALRGEVVAAKTSLQTLTSTLGRTIKEGAGMFLGGAMVGLDAYEFAHAENDLQKAVFGTQLAFDSASAITGAAGVSAGLIGASAAGAVLGGGGVILGGLAVGFTGLAQVFGAVAEDAKSVGRYFSAVDAAYKGHGYRYEAKQRVLVPLPGAVVKALNLRDGQIQFDSQYLYRTDSLSTGASGSGKSNYFFWAGHMPWMVHDRKQAIEVRSGIGYQSNQSLPFSDSKTVILPGTPKSYISYEYQILPFATLRHDDGFDVIRKLEGDFRFDYDFYIFPSERTVRRIHQAYVATAIQVVLGHSHQQLVMPELPKYLHGYLRYQIKGGGGEYLLGLNEGASVELSSDTASAPSRWVIDTSLLDRDDIIVAKNRLVVGGVVVDFDPSQKKQIWVANRLREVREIDFKNLTTRVLSEDASKWQSLGQLEQHLRDQANAHHSRGQYVVVENHLEKGHERGRAFFDVVNKRMLVSDAPNKLSRSVHLAAVTEKYTYFYDTADAIAWRVLSSSGERDTNFAPWFSSQKGAVKRVWQEADKVYVAERHTMSGDNKGELVYQIQGNGIELMSVAGDNELLQNLTPLAYLKSLKSLQNTSSARQEIVSILAPLVTVHGKDRAGQAHRFWVRTNDSTVIKPNLSPPADQTLRVFSHGQSSSAWPIPDDLVLAGSIPRSGAEEVFFFYSKTQKVLFRQEGPGQLVLNAQRPTAFRLETPALANVLNLNGHVVVVTEDGRVARLSAAGQLGFEAVNEHWFKNRSAWWKDLETVTGKKKSTLALFGFKRADGRSALPVWYHNGQVVVASAEIQGESLQFLGFDEAHVGAWLFEPASGKLYRQPSISPTALGGLFGSDKVLKASAQVPIAVDILPGLQLKTVEPIDGKWRLTTYAGEVLLQTGRDLQLIAVNKVWQTNHASHLVASLMSLADRWRVKGVITLENNETPSWFDAARRRWYSARGIGTHAHLRFVGGVAGQPAVYVYNTQTYQLYRSVGGDFKPVENGGGRLNGSLYITEYGRVIRIGVAGQLGVETADEHWVEPVWWQKLLNEFQKNPLTVTGVKQSDNKTPLTVFSHNGQIVVVPAELQGKSLRVLFFEQDGSGAWLSDPVSGKFYLQPSMDTAELASAFGSGKVLKEATQVPAARERSADFLGWRTAGKVISSSCSAKCWAQAIVPKKLEPYDIQQRSPWWKELASKKSSHEVAVAVFGVKGAGGNNMLPVWYHKGQIVIVSGALQHLPLKFLGFESDGSGARFFDPASGKLYRQSATSTATLARAFGGDEVLKSAQSLPSPSELLPDLRFKAAEQIDGGLRLSTVKGEVLTLADNGKLELLTVNRKWQKSNSARLPQALAELTTHWRVSGVITLHGNDTPKWFDIGSAQLFSAIGSGPHEDLRFVGKAAGVSGAYVYETATRQLRLIKQGDAQVQVVGKFGKVQRVGSTLLFKGDANSYSQDEMLAPLVDGIETLVLQGGMGKDAYRLSDEVWRHYHTVVIDNDDPQQALDQLIMPVIDPKKILVSRRDDDLMLVDFSSAKTLLIRKVFGSQAEAYKHLQIEMGVTVFDVDRLVQSLIATGDNKDKLLNLSQAIKPLVSATPRLASPLQPESPSLSKLSGAMALFTDSGRVREHLHPIGQRIPAVLASSPY